MGARAARPSSAAIAGGEALAWGVQANTNPPVLRTHDRYGHRIDEVEFHPAWHELMRLAVHHELHALPWRDSAARRARRARRAVLHALARPRPATAARSR